ncbi:glycosyltransferase family 2 protein [Ktedonobacter robiniae]|uniref:glycosyltransferase family 2 protein n=1 Tax=Ktedonobacter robiniae TaxID=2778365 RepID=UPI0019163763|nr:glycosyltransferase family 2 protein [Ktedonobacter robiniae]
MLLIVWLRWLLAGGEILFLLPITYLCLVCLAALLEARRRVRQEVNVTEQAGASRFSLLVPAHDEEVTLPGLLKSLQGLTYAREHYRIYIVADNCHDRTAEIARSSENVRVYERFDTEKRGKGYALHWLLGRIETEADDAEWADAYVILDADSIVEPGFLTVLDRELAAGAVALQMHNTVLNGSDSPSTVLRWLALTLVNHVRQLGRNALGSSATLTGNGMCLRRTLLQRHPWQSFSVTEDYQYYLQLVEHGERVRYVPEAVVRSHMPTSFEQMRTQDIRWESGAPEQPGWKTALRLLQIAARERDWVRLETAFEFLTPPLSLMVGGSVLLFLLSCVLYSWLTLGLACVLLLGLACYLGTGLYFMRPTRETYQALWHAPRFMLWKLWVYLVVRRSKQHSAEWVRTSRSSVALGHSEEGGQV